MYLESTIDIYTGRPPSIFSAPSATPTSELYNELAHLLLEGVISKRNDDEAEVDSVLGELHRRKLRRLLAWPRARIWSKLLMPSLPLSFLRERALLLGWLGRHEAMLRIFYFDLKSLGLALEYCNTCYER